MTTNRHIVLCVTQNMK